MSASIITDENSPAGKVTVEPVPRWQTIFMWVAPLALLAIAICMRLFNLGQPFDHDGYDEGVYWQSLRAMAAGHMLYSQIFYSQPPFFLLSTYPIFAFFGETLWSARFGIALVSLLGLPGAFLMGKALSGRIGAIVAMLLLVLDPLYLSMSQKIEAEVSSTAFSFLAVGAAYLWWENPEGPGGLYLAALSGITLSLGILCKLLSVTCIVPVGLLLLARLWQIWHKQPGTNMRSLRPIVIASIACLATFLIVLAPFLGSYSSMLRDVITFHTDAKTALINNQVHNAAIMQSFLQSTLPLIIAAAFGLLAALLRRDWRVLPLVAWTLITLYVLWIQVPLFYRHFIALIPPLISLAVIGVGSISSARDFFARFRFPQVLTSLAVLLILVIIATDLPQYQPYYQAASKRGNDTYAKLQAHVANDVRDSIAPDQLVITDGQFVVSMAARNTPPDLVDTSIVRVVTGYVTLQQLVHDASQPRVHAVLFFMDRLHLPQLAAFYTWVAQHFHLKYRYGPGKELWVR